MNPEKFVDCRERSNGFRVSTAVLALLLVLLLLTQLKSIHLVLQKSQPFSLSLVAQVKKEKKKKMEKTKIGKRFEGKVAIVTASTQGIGFSIAQRLGLEGASVVVSSRRQVSLWSSILIFDFRLFLYSKFDSFSSFYLLFGYCRTVFERK